MRRHLLVILLALGFSVIAEAATEHTFDIRPQTLANAITAFSSQSGLQVRVQGTLPNIQAAAVTGTFTSDRALSRLLQGSGWVHYIVSDTEVLLMPAEDGSFADTITVLGSRIPNAPLSAAPASVSVVTPEQVERERAIGSRVEDLLAHQVPGFNPTNNGVRNIRGRTAQVWVNGAPVNEQLRASSGADLNLLLVDQVAGIEVARGTSSVYGFGSPGGIIALSTPRATTRELQLKTVLRESFNPHALDESHQALIYQSASKIVNDVFDFHVGGAFSYDGLEHAPNGELALGFDNAVLTTNGAESVMAFDTSIGFNFGERGRLRLNGTYSDVDVHERFVVTGGTFGGEFARLQTQAGADDSFRDAHTATLTYDNDRLFGQAVKLDIFSSRAHSVVVQDLGTLVRDEQENEYFGMRSSVTTSLSRLSAGSQLTWGVDAQRNRYYRPVYVLATGARFTYFSPDVTLDTVSGYAQLDWNIGERLRLSSGVRHEEYGGAVKTTTGPLTISGGDIQGFDLTLVNGSLTYSLRPTVDVYASYSQGSEITQLGRAARAVKAAAQIDPQPAKSNQYEGGLRADFGKSRVALAAFYTESDLLSALSCDATTPCTPLREPREFWGVELSGSTRLTPLWTVSGVASWQDGERTVNGVDRPIGSRDISPLLVSSTLNYDSTRSTFGALQLNYRGARDPFPATSTAFGEGPVDAAFTVNLLGGVDTRGGRVQLGIENVFNTEYTSIAAGAGNTASLWVPEEGTRVTLSFSPRW